MFKFSAEAVLEHKLAEKGDLIIVTAGVPVGVSGSTNMLKVERV